MFMPPQPPFGPPIPQHQQQSQQPQQFNGAIPPESVHPSATVGAAMTGPPNAFPPPVPGGFPPPSIAGPAPLHQQQPLGFSGISPAPENQGTFPPMPGPPGGYSSAPSSIPPSMSQQQFGGAGTPPAPIQQGIPPMSGPPSTFPAIPGGFPPPIPQQPQPFGGAMPPAPGHSSAAVGGVMTGAPPAFPPSSIPVPGGFPPSTIAQQQMQQPFGAGIPPAPGQQGAFPPMQGPPGAFSAAPGGFLPGPPQPQRQRLDPDMMPSLVQVVDDDRSSRLGLFPTGFPQAESPPLVSTEIIAQDQGNSNPKFMRSTLYVVPQNNDMVKATQVPLSLAICPFAKLNQNEYPPPAIDLGEIGPIRCQRCKAYMCPFMEFIDGGRKFRCPFCKSNTPVEDGYFAHLDHTGRRTDIQHRPELFLGSYEFVATKQYCKNGIPPKQPAFIFMLDVSYNAVRNGLVELFCRNIATLLRDLPRENFREQSPSKMRIGLATYDQSVHFYNLSQPERAEMLVVNDMTDIFVPFVDGFLVEFEQAESALTVCLREIVRNFAHTRITETALGPVIQAGLDALRSADRAGKLFIFHTSLPTLEGAPGQLKSREDRKLLGTDKEKTILSPATEFYAKLGDECVKWGCAVDLFLFPNSFMDVASIAPAVSTTGGVIYKYQYFDAERDGDRFLADLRHDISREIVFDVMMRLRTSTGIRPTGFFGSFYMQNTTDIELATLDADKAVQIEIKYDDKLDEREAAYFQVAVLFTSCGGQRRLRIHNLSLPVSADYATLYRLIDEDCLAAHLFKQAEQIVREKSPKEMREELTMRCAQILAAYREKCSESAPMGQLILPESAKLLPLHVNCIARHDALNGGAELTVDDRAWMMSLVPSQTVLSISHLLYPRIYPLTGLGSGRENDEPAENGGAPVVKDTDQDDEKEMATDWPPQLRASFEYLHPQEAYLIENGLVAFVFVSKDVSKDWLNNVFGVPSVQQLDTEKQHELPKRPNAQSAALRKLWRMANANRERCLKLFIIKEGDALEAWMKKFLVEDRYAQNAHSYVDFLCMVHREIRAILS